MRSHAALLVIFCIPPFLAAAPVPKERAEAERVVGVWKLVKSSNQPGGLTVSLEMELTQTGRVILRQAVNGQVAVYEGEYKIIKDQLPYSISHPGGVRKSETLTIKKLTATELVVVDPDGIQEDFERVPKKKFEEGPLPKEKK